MDTFKCEFSSNKTLLQNNRFTHGKMVVKDWTYQHILPQVSWLAIQLLYSTIRIQTLGEDEVKRLRNEKKKIVYVLWHGRQFLVLRYMAHKHIGAMASTSRDGKLIANILQRWGYKIIPGSSEKNPVRALFGGIKKMRAGFHTLLTVDGPRGPIYKVKPGALFLAKKMNAFIVPITFSAKPAIMFKSWDKYLLPKPFARAVIVFGKPLHLSSDKKECTIQEECQLLEKTLNQITERADSMI